MKPPSKEVIAKKIEMAQKTHVLALRECGLKDVPKAAVAADGASFRTVDLSVNRLVSLPEGIAMWTGVQKLLCSQNLITDIPGSIGSLVSLQTMELSNNQLKSLPAEIGALGKLKILSLDKNKLGPRLPDVFGGGGLRDALEELDLSWNALEGLSPSIAELRALARLVIANNALSELPKTLSGLVKLRYLDASNNQLRGVPSEVLEKTCLSELWLKGNPMDLHALQDLPGFNTFLERRKQRLDAKIDSHVVGKVDLSVCGLE